MKYLLSKIRSVFYMYGWLKRLLCKYWGHKTSVRYMVYQQSKIVKNHDKTEIKREKVCYDPYFVYYCTRCGKKLGTKRLKRKLSKEEAFEFSKSITQQIKAINDFKKSKKK